MNDYFLLPITFVLSFLGTWLIIYLSKRHRWLDIPNERSSHSEPAPTAGGVAFVVVFVVISIFAFRDAEAEFIYILTIMLSCFVAAMGLMDDISELPIVPRILTQFVALIGALAIFGSPVFPIFSFTLELGWIAYLLMAMGMLWFINLFNFMDGIDGLAAVETLFICLAVAFLTFSDNTGEFNKMLLILVAAVSGFLLLNYAPARIFMGDTGSNFLGYMLCVLALVSTTSGFTNIWVWCILAGIFIIDSTFTLFSRMRSGETWYYAHRTHAYQLAAGYLNSHGKVVFLATLINLCWLLPLAWLSHTQREWGFLLTLVAWLPLILLVYRLRALKN